jgi:hypothetical protein
MGFNVVAAGIHIRVVAPAQRRTAWWNFVPRCAILASGVYLWVIEHDFAATVVLTGWVLAGTLLVLIGLGIGSVSYAVSHLLREVKQASAGHTTSLDAP